MVPPSEETVSQKNFTHKSSLIYSEKLDLQNVGGENRKDYEGLKGVFD